MTGFQVAGDLALSADERELLIVTGAEMSLQQIKAGAEIWAGSLAWDPFAGLPMLQSILVKGPDLRLITQVFRQFLLDSAGVVTVDQLNVSPDRAARELTVPFTVTCEDGEGASDELRFALA